MPVLTPGAKPAPAPLVEWAIEGGMVVGVRTRRGVIRAVEPVPVWTPPRRAPAAVPAAPEPRQDRAAARELLAAFPSPAPRARGVGAGPLNVGREDVREEVRPRPASDGNKARLERPAPRAQLSLLGDAP